MAISAKGSGYAIVAYETLRYHWKRLTEGGE